MQTIEQHVLLPKSTHASETHDLFGPKLMRYCLCFVRGKFAQAPPMLMHGWQAGLSITFHWNTCACMHVCQRRQHTQHLAVDLAAGKIAKSNNRPHMRITSNWVFYFLSYTNCVIWNMGSGFPSCFSCVNRIGDSAMWVCCVHIRSEHNYNKSWWFGNYGTQNKVNVCSATRASAFVRKLFRTWTWIILDIIIHVDKWRFLPNNEIH